MQNLMEEKGENVDSLREAYSFFFFFFYLFIYMGCPGQLARTTTIPHGPLNILQAQGQVRHRGGDRRAHRGSNPGRGRNKSHDWPQQLDPQVRIFLLVVMVVVRDFNHLISRVNGFFHVGLKSLLILEFRVHETFCI